MLAVTVVWVLAGDAVCKFVQMRFAGEDEAGAVRGGDERGLFVSSADLGEEGRAREGWRAADIKQVFGEVRDAAECPAGLAGLFDGGREHRLRLQPGDGRATLRRREARLHPMVELAGRGDGGELLPFA